MDRNKLLSGNGGTIWLDGELMGNVKSVEAKISGSFSDVQCCGDPATYPGYEGYTAEGTLEFYKVNSDIAVKYAKAFETGDIPSAKIITKVNNPATGRSERWAINGVVFTEIAVAKFEAHKIIEDSLPFKFISAENLETL